MIKNIKKILISIIAVFSFAFILNVSTVKAAGEYATISGGGTINEDGSVSVTVNITNNDGLWGAEGTLSYDSSVIEYSGSASGATVNGGNGQITFVQDYDGVSKAGSITVKFKAVGTGNTNVSLAACSVIGQDTNPVNCAGGVAAVSVVQSNQSTPADNPSNTTNQGSSDATLSSLVISPGKLSPAFSSGTKNYTVQLDEDVTAITVSATPKDSKAKVLSVNGAKSLKPGKNTVSVVVQAENGAKSTYYITVYCGEVVDEDGLSEVDVKVNGNDYVIANVIPDSVIPDDFEETSMDYSEKKIKVLKYANGNLNLVYLRNKEDDSSALYVFDKENDIFYPYIKVVLNDEHFIILIVPGKDVTIPENISQSSYNVNGTDFVAYQKNAEGEDKNSFLYVYTMNKAGVLGWYQYDLTEGTYQRCTSFGDDMVPLEEYDKLKAQVDILKQQYEDNTKSLELYVYIAAGIAIILLIVLIATNIVKSKKIKTLQDGRDDDDSDEDSFEETEIASEPENAIEPVEKEEPEIAIETVVEDEPENAIEPVVEEKPENTDEALDKAIKESLDKVIDEALEEAMTDIKIEEPAIEIKEVIDDDDDFEIFTLDD